MDSFLKLVSMVLIFAVIFFTVVSNQSHKYEEVATAISE